MIQLLILLCLLYSINAQIDNATKLDIQGNEHLNPLEVIRKYGYPVERHRVTTDDGYIIEMHRIPYDPPNRNITNRPAILIAHGSIGSSAEIVNFGKKSLGFFLVDHGYDVWIGNARGTIWSRRHKWLSPNSKKFWMFTFHEISVYDIPAEIDYIRNTTGQEKIFFLGHSQGATALFAMASVRPEVNDKLRLGVAFAPSVYTKHNRNHAQKFLAHNYKLISRFLGTYGTYEVPYIRFSTELVKSACHKDNPMFFLCSGLLGAIMGYDTEELDPDLFPVIAGHIPAGVSFLVFAHYSQLYISGKFRQFDYGTEGNLKKYGTAEPPDYNISKVTCPVGLFYSGNDAFSDVKDSEDLAKVIPNLALKYLVPNDTFNHIGFLFGIHVVDLVYKPLLELLAKY